MTRAKRFMMETSTASVDMKPEQGTKAIGSL
jgi:hypothetical protein